MRDVVEFGHIATHVSRALFFPENKAGAWHAVEKREIFHNHCAVFVEHGRCSRIEYVIAQGVGWLPAHGFHDCLQQFGAFAADMYCDFAFDVVERHCRQQPWQSEKVVAVYVGDEYIPQFCVGYSVAAHLQLCAFAAVDHEQTVVERQHLRTWQVTQGRSCRPASEDSDVEI